MDTEHLSMLPKTWLEYQQYEDVHVAITKKLYNAYCTPKYVYVEKYLKSWDPKIHGPRNHLLSFYVATLVYKCVNKKHYPLAMFRNCIWKKTRPSYKVNMNYENPFSSYDSEMASKVKKNISATFEKNEDEFLFS